MANNSAGQKISTTMVMSIVLLLVAIAVLLYLVMGPKPVIGGAGSAPLSEDTQAAVLLLKTRLDSCLSGESRDAGLKAISAIESGTLDISAGLSVRRILGAIDYENEEIRAVVEKDIRACVKDVMPKVEACILGDCQSAVAPGAVGMKFKYPKTTNENLAPDKLRIGFALKQAQPLLAYDPMCDCFAYSMRLPGKGEQVEASLYNVVHEAFMFRSDDDSERSFCLQRATELPLAKEQFTRWKCTDKTCQHDGKSPRWLESCPPEPSPTASFRFSLISKAYAQPVTAQAAWYIPSLATLESREEFKGVGHTEFVVSNTGSLNVDADGYFVDVQVNGRSVMIDGTPASYNVQAHTSGDPIEYRFGLQNMDFAGRHGGCDHIAASIQFVRDGRLLDDKVALERSYVALRHAAAISSSGLNDTWEWRGTYHPAPNEYEHEVFLAGVEDTNLSLANYQLAENAPALQRLKDRADRLKSEFDALNVTYQGQSVVAVIRPPLTKVSYGIAAGLVRPTGQVSFLFSKADTYKLLADLKNRRADGSVAYKRAVRDDIWVYPITGGTTSGDLSNYGCS